MHRLTKAQARRIAVRAQLLDAPWPTKLLAVVQRLTLLLHAIHEDVKFTRTMTKAVQAELEDLASWLGLRAVEPGYEPRLETIMAPANPGV